MISRLRQLLKDNSGQAMIAALACLALGGLIIAPVINYTGTTVHSISLKGKDMRGLYAADAGIENALWSLKRGVEPATSLSQNPNGMQVTINTINRGAYTLIAGEWESTNSHSTWLTIITSMVWDAGHGAYKYSVNATYSGSGNCKLIEIGARLPVGYSYEAGSASLFGTNLSTGIPNDDIDGNGAHLISWDFPQTAINPTGTQTFYVTGSGTIEHDYGWAEATRDDVGEVSQLTGTFYVITATARKDGVIAGKIEANVMKSGSDVTITSYRVLD
ncbi:MAG: hypothetical protein Q7R57_04495 [Dehalococcoidales bacterium]|nr:hypothetical protein [Dehalococcoidales bacterium]